MLLVLSGIASATSGSPSGSPDQQAHSDALSHVTSYVGYLVFPRIGNDDLSEADRLEAVKFLSESAGVLADMMREAADAGDLAFFDDAVAKWREFGQLWRADHDHSSGGDDTPLRTAQDVLDRLRFVICSWQLRRLWTDPGDNAGLHAFTSLATFDDVQRIFDLAAMPHGDPASWRLSNWILSALPAGQAHAIDTATPTLRALVLIALKLGPQPGLALRPSQWLLDNAGRIQDTITQVEATSDLVATVAIANAAAAAAVLRAAVAEAAAQQERTLEEELLRASVDDTRVHAFAAAARESWAKRRIAANLLRLAGAYEDIDGSNPDARYGYRGNEPKDWYVSDRIADLEGHAQQVGNVIAEGENARLYEAIATARPLRRSADDINQRLDHAIEIMRQNGYKPTAIFVPWRVWQLPPELDLQPLAAPHDSADVVRGILGRFRDLDVVEMRDLPADRVVLADLQAFATFRQWTRGADALAITVAGFDEQTAKAAARADRRLLRQPGRTELADRARELRKLVFVQALEEFALQVKTLRWHGPYRCHLQEGRAEPASGLTRLSRAFLTFIRPEASPPAYRPARWYILTADAGRPQPAVQTPCLDGPVTGPGLESG